MKAFVMSFSRRNAVLWTALLLALFAVAMVIAANRFAPSETGHAYEHLAAGTAIALLAVATSWLWPPRGSRIGQVARAGVVAGLSIFGGGQLLESIGAFGFRRFRIINEPLATLHDIALASPFIGMLFLALAGLLILLLMATRLVTRLRRPQEGGTSYQDVRET